MTDPTSTTSGARWRVSPAGGAAAVVAAVALVAYLGVVGTLIAAAIWTVVALAGYAVRAGARAVTAHEAGTRAVQARVAVTTGAAAVLAGAAAWQLPVPVDHEPAVILGAAVVVTVLVSATLAEASRAWITRSPDTTSDPH